MFSAAKRHTMERLKAAEIRTAPFPHILVNDIFPADFYAEVLRHMMRDTSYVPLVKTGRVGQNYSPARLCFTPLVIDAVGEDAESMNFWRDFFIAYNDAEFLQCWLEVFDGQLRTRINNDVSEGRAEAAAEMLLMRDKESYMLNPHMDSPSKAISALFYMPPDESQIMQGTSVYSLKQDVAAFPGGYHAPRENFELMGTMPFRPNTVFAFPNLQDSYHGVEPFGLNQNRDVLLYDVKFMAPHGKSP